MRGSNFIDLTGQKFGRLKVIKRVENDKWCQSQWLCECNCKDKNETVTSGSNLRKGNTQSCGCLQKEKASIVGKSTKRYNLYNLTGDFGIGYTRKNKPFYFELEDYNKIKNYCWWEDDAGYIISKSSDREIVYMHRLIMDCPDNLEVDHEFHNKYDNRKKFLRFVTRSQNQMNKVIPSNNTSGVKGVCWHIRQEQWQATITKDYKKIHLGYFNNINDAIDAREEAEKEYFGEYNYKELSVGDSNN